MEGLLLSGQCWITGMELFAMITGGLIFYLSATSFLQTSQAAWGEVGL